MAQDHRMTMREFQETGCAQEVNRRLLHPRGIELIIVEHYADGDLKHEGEVQRWSFGGIAYFQGDPEGIRYDDEELNDPRTIERFHAFELLGANLRETREQRLGCVVQSLIFPGEAIPDPAATHEEEVAHWQSLWSRAVAEGRTSTARVAELETELEQARTGTPEPAAEAVGDGPDESGWDAEQPRQSFLALRALYMAQGRDLQRTKSLLATAEKGEKKTAAGYGSEPEKLEESPALDEMVEVCRDAFVAGLKAFAYFEGITEVVGELGVRFETAREKTWRGNWDHQIHLAVTAGQDRRGTS